MQLSGKYQIANCDMQKIIDDFDLLETTRRIVLYESGITDSDNWRFEHNNFQEYLAAKKLAQCSWAQMQQILFLPNKKLKPKWHNALSFLINQLDSKSEQHKQLVEWLIENDRIAFIKLEVIHLDQTIRNQVFYSVYSYYKEKEIVFYAEFSAQELAKFCNLENNQELINFLLGELKPEMNIHNLYNIVELFGAIKPSDRKDIDRIALALSGYLKEEEYNKYNINSSILEIYINWGWQNEVFFNEAINEDTLIKDGSTRSNLLLYLQKNQTSLLTANLIIRCLKIRQNDTINTSMYYLKEAISALSNLEIITLLDELTPGNENYQSNKQERDFIDVVKAIEVRASLLYPKCKEILPAINKFVLATLDHVFRAEPAWAIWPFYEKHSLVFPLFKEAFLSEKQETDAKPLYYRFKLSGFLADFECLDWVLDEYKQGNFTENDIRNFWISISHYNNGNGYQRLTEIMNEISNGTFFPNNPDVYNETNKKVDELYAQAILDKEIYISYIERAFVFYSKDEISWKEFWDREDEKNHIGDVEFHTNRRCLRDFMDKDKTTTKQEVLNSLQTESYWEGLQLEEHYELSKNGKLQKENVDWVINWCKEHEIEIDVKNAIREERNGHININRWTVYYIQFCLDTDYFSQSKQVLLDLTSCLSHFADGPRKSEKTGNDLTLYEYLQTHLSNVEINERVIQNIEEGIESDMVLNEHLKIIENENLVDAVDSLPLYILESRWRKWTSVVLI
jgi:hypothetical protein